MTVEYNFILKLINTSTPGITDVALKTLQMAHGSENAGTVVSESLVSAPALSSEQLSTVATQPLSAPPILNKRAGSLFF